MPYSPQVIKILEDNLEGQKTMANHDADVLRLEDLYAKWSSGKKITWEEREIASNYAKVRNADQIAAKAKEETDRLVVLQDNYPDYQNKRNIEYGEWKDIGDGFSIRESTSHPRQEIRTPDGNMLTRGFDDNGAEYRQFEFSSHDPLAKGAMDWVDEAIEILKASSQSIAKAEGSDD